MMMARQGLRLASLGVGARCDSKAHAADESAAMPKHSDLSSSFPVPNVILKLKPAGFRRLSLVAKRWRPVSDKLECLMRFYTVCGITLGTLAAIL